MVFFHFLTGGVGYGERFPLFLGAFSFFFFYPDSKEVPEVISPFRWRASMLVDLSILWRS